MTQYQKVKQYLITGIQAKRWVINQRLPSENELVKQCQVSRMTARRAIKELEAAGLIHSIRGKGTFITAPKHQSSAIELRNIKDEVIASDKHYHCVVKAQELRQCETLCTGLEIARNSLFYSSVVHFEDNKPIQLEQRYVNPDMVPDYLSINLGDITANEYLTQQCPAQEVTHQIEAVTATSQQRQLLELASAEPCLKVTRTTRYQGQVVSYATLYHPGTRYVLGTRFTLETSQEKK